MKYLLRLMMGMLGFLAICCAGIVFILGSAIGRQWLVTEAVPFVVSATGYQLDIENVSSPKLGLWKIGSITAFQEEGSKWIINDVVLRWQPGILLREKRIMVEALSIAEITAEIVPGEKDADFRQQDIAFPFIPRFTVDMLHIASVDIAHPSLPDPQRYEIKGNIDYLKETGRVLAANLNVESLVGTPFSLALHTEVDALGYGPIHVVFKEGAGGPVARWLREDPQQQGIELSFVVLLSQLADGYEVEIKDINTRYQTVPVSGHGTLTYIPEKNWLTVQDVKLQLGASLTNLSGDLRHNDFTVQVNSKAFPLAILSPWLEEPVEGYADAILVARKHAGLLSVEVQTDITALYRQLEGRLTGKATLTGQKLRIEQAELMVNQTRAKLAGTVDFGQKQMDVNADIHHLVLDDLRKFNVELPPEITGNLSTNLVMQGAWNNPNIVGNATFAGVYRQLPVFLEVIGSGNKENITIEKMHLGSGKQTLLSLQGRYAKKGMDLVVEAQDFPVTILSSLGIQSVPSGNLDMNLQIQGTLERPVFHGTVQFDTALSSYSGVAISESVPLSFRLKIDSDEEMIHGDMSIVTVKENRNVGSLFISFPLEPYMKLRSLNGMTPLQGALQADIDLSYFNVFLESLDHRIKGKVKADIKVTGMVADPQFQGQLMMDQGYYKHQKSGVVLQNIMARIAAQNNGLEIIEFKAYDAHEGKVILKGGIDISSLYEPEIDLTALLQEIRILDRYDMQASANGTIRLQGDVGAMKLEGNVEMVQTTILLDAMLPGSVPELKVTEIYQGTDVSQKDKKEKQEKAVNIVLDIAVHADQKIFVRGRGVEAELSGDIIVDGSASQPHYAGEFHVIRGSYTLLNKKFLLDDRSFVRFENQELSLLISGVYERSDLQVTVNLSGAPDDLSVTLSSVPVLPEDEIVARLLFNKSVGDISILQALRLANELNRLRNGGRQLFLDPVEQARELLGVDSLTVDSAETEDGTDMTVGVGKYISDKVYLQFERGSDPVNPWKGSVEVELLPHLTLESGVGGDAGTGGVELQWKHDY